MTNPAACSSRTQRAENAHASCCGQAGRASSNALRTSLPDDHPIAILLDEHQAILAGLGRLTALSASSAPPPGRAVAEELGQLVELLIAAEPHHRREEQVLFPALRERGLRDQPAAMTTEHVRLREVEHALQHLVQGMLAGERGKWGELCATAEALVEMLREHIAREENLLYPLALGIIREPAVWNELRRRCAAIGPGPLTRASLADARA